MTMSMNNQPITLIGPTVCLEPISEKHLADLTYAGRDKQIWQWMLYGDLTNEASMHGFIKLMLNLQAQGSDLPFAVIHRESDKAVGCTRFSYMRPEHRTLEIGGSWYDVDYQRTAVNTECKYLMLRQAFEVWQCNRVQFLADLRNVRSQQAIERLGAVKEGVLRQHYIRADGTVRESAVFSIIQAEWPMVKANLEKRLQQ